MKTRSKDIGTRAESAIVKYAQAQGFPQARRQALAGAKDQGDVHLAEGLILEVKAGHAGENASKSQLQTWWEQTLVEQANARAVVGVLIVKRKGKSGANCGQWDAYMSVLNFLTLMQLVPQLEVEGDKRLERAGLVRLSVDSFLALARCWQET